MAQKSVSSNGCELVVANDLDDIMQNDHKLQLVTATDVEEVTSDKRRPNYLAKVVAERAWGML